MIALSSWQPNKITSKISSKTEIISYQLTPNPNLKFYWKKPNGQHFRSIDRLKKRLQDDGKQLQFAMNGGMYKPDLSPQGLFIEEGVEKVPKDDKTKGYGNFYLQPNGVFYLDNNHQPFICTTTNFTATQNCLYATQSGPMLIIDGNIHPKFIEGSNHKHIRNGVGILPNGNILFAISKEKINFYDFALFFKNNGCKNALYLDGFVSRAYIPSKGWEQLDGNFGIIIAETY